MVSERERGEAYRVIDDAGEENVGPHVLQGTME